LICNPVIDETRTVMTTALRERIKELAMDPMMLQSKFNKFFIQTDKVQMKINRVSREIMFDNDGLKFGSGENAQIALS